MRAVIDTNVIFEGLTKQGSVCGLIVDAWRAGLIEACVTNALAYEYEDVLGRKLSARRWTQIQPVLRSLLGQAEFVTIYFSWRPSSPDPGDDHLIDCAMNADATVVTANIRDLAQAQKTLGLRVMSPVEFVMALTDPN
ncbi:MAG: PIN domain-containing protein [Acidobacteria bacterium]|nr:PIN domain-containing protein [Acidobacteriota bacterium]MBI3425941.1 PIN domain-containing protein [Acidobacteriota bacterium]